MSAASISASTRAGEPSRSSAVVGKNLGDRHDPQNGS